MRLLASEHGFVPVSGYRGHGIGVPENTLAALRPGKAAGATHDRQYGIHPLPDLQSWLAAGRP